MPTMLALAASSVPWAGTHISGRAGPTDRTGRPYPGIEVTFGAAMEPQRTLPETPYTEAVIRGARAGLGEEPLLAPALVPAWHPRRGRRHLRQFQRGV